MAAAATAELAIVIRAKEDASAALKTVEKLASNLGTSVKQLQTQFQQNFAQLTQITGKMKTSVDQNMTATRNSIVNKLREASQQGQRELKTLEAQATKTITNIANKSKGLTAPSGIAEQLSRTAARAAAVPQSVVTAQALAQASRAITDFARFSQAAGNSVGKAFANIGVSLEAVTKGEAIRGLANLTKGISAAAETAGIFQVALGSLAAVVPTVISALTFATKVAADFDTALKNLQIQTNATADLLGDLKVAAIEFSDETGRSFEEVVKGFEEVAVARPELLKNVDALKEVTHHAVVLAEATGQDIPTAVHVMTAALGQFSLSSKEAGHVTDVLAASVQAGTSSLPEFGRRLEQVGSIAGNAGLSLEETSAILTTLSLQHIPLRRFSTGLQQFFQGLQSGSQETNPAVVGLSKALENLANEHLSLIEIQARFGGQQSAQVVQALIDNREKVDELTKSMGRNNEAQTAANIRSTTLGVAMERLWASTRNAAGVIGGPFERAATALADKARENTSAVTEWFAELQRGTPRLEQIRQAIEQLQVELDKASQTRQIAIGLGPEVVGNQVQVIDQHIAELQSQLTALQEEERQLVEVQADWGESNARLAEHQKLLGVATMEVSRILGKEFVESAKLATAHNREMRDSGMRTEEGLKTWLLVLNEVNLQQKETAQSTGEMNVEFGYLGQTISKVTRDALGLDFRKFNDGVRDAIQQARGLRLELQDSAADLDARIAAFGTRTERIAGAIGTIQRKTDEATQKIGTDAAPRLVKIAEALENIRQKREALARLPLEGLQPPPIDPEALDREETRLRAEQSRLQTQVSTNQAKTVEVGLLDQSLAKYNDIKDAADKTLAVTQGEVDVRAAGVRQSIADAQIQLQNVQTQEQREDVMKRIQGLEANLRDLGREKLQNEIKSLENLRAQAAALGQQPEVEKLDQQLRLKRQALAVDLQTNTAAADQNAILQSRYQEAARVRTQAAQAEQQTADLTKTQIGNAVEILQLGLEEEHSITQRQDIQRRIIELKKAALQIDIQALQNSIARTQEDLRAGTIAPALVEQTKFAVEQDQKRLAILQAGIPVLDAQLDHVKELGKETAEVGRQIEDAFGDLITEGLFDFGKSKDTLKKFADSGIGILKSIFSTTIKNKLDFEGIISKNLFTDQKGLVHQFGVALGLIQEDTKETFTNIVGVVKSSTDAAGKTILTVEPAVKQAAEALETVGPTAEKAAQAVSDAGTEAQGGWGSFFDFLISTGKSVFEKLIGFAAGFLKLLSGSGGGSIVGALGGVATLVSSLFGGGGGGAAAVAQRTGGGGVLAGAARVPGVLGTASFVDEKLFGSAVSEGIQNGFKGLGLDKLFSGIQTVIKIAGPLLSIVGGVFTLMKGKGGLLDTGGAALGILGGVQGLGNFLSELGVLSQVGPGISGLSATPGNLGANLLLNALGFSGQGGGIAGAAGIFGKIPVIGPVLDSLVVAVKAAAQAIGQAVGVIAAPTAAAAGQAAAQGGAAAAGAAGGSAAGSALGAVGVVGGLAGLGLGIKGAIEAKTSQGKAGAAIGAAAGLFAVAAAIWIVPVIGWVIAAVLAIIGAIISATAPKPDIRELLKEQFAERLSTIMGANVTPSMGDYKGAGVPTRVRIKTGVDKGQYITGREAKARVDMAGGGAIGLFGRATVASMGPVALRRPDLAGNFENMIFNVLARRGADQEAVNKAIRNLTRLQFGTIYNVLNQANAYEAAVAKMKGKGDKDRPEAVLAKRRIGYQQFGAAFDIAGVDLGAIFAANVNKRGGVNMPEVRKQTRDAVLQAIEDGAEFTTKEANRLGDRVLKIVAAFGKATGDPKAVAALVDQLRKNDPNITVKEISKEVRKAMTVKTLVEARGLDVTELPADFLTNLEDYVDRVQTKRGGGKKARARRERRTALATTLLDQERDVVRTREMIVGQLTGTTSVVQAKQATEDAARARKRLDQLQEEVPKLKKTKRKQEALDEAKDQMEALKQATEAWAKTVSDLVDQIRQAERGLQDFQIQMFETIDGLTGATDTGQKYQSFLDDNEKKYNDLVTAGSSAGAQLELVNRQLQLLQAQAQATIQDINEQAQAYHDAIQRQRDVLDAYTEAIERESRIEQRAIRDLQDDIDKNQKEIETRQDKLDELADRRSKLQDRLSDISPLADLTDGLKQMKESLTGTIKGGGFAELAQTRQKLGEAVAQFQGETDLQKKATAGAEVQRLAGLAVEQGQKLYSVGSRDLTRLRQQSLAAIEGVLETAQAAEDERTKILADIKSIDEEAKGIQEEIKGYQKKIKEDNEKIEGHTKRLRDLADAQQIIDDKRKPLDDADRAIAKAQAEKIDEVNQKLAAQLKIWSDKAVPLMQAQIGNLREQLKAIVPPGTDIDALINDPSSLQAFLAQAQLETLQSIEDYLEGFSKSLNIPPRPGKRHRTTAAAAEGGIILRDSIIRAGEGNKPEVIIPLESPRGRRLLGLDRPVPRNGGAHEPTFIFQPTIVMPQPKSMAEAKLYGRSASSGFSAQVKQALPGITRRAGGRG